MTVWSNLPNILTIGRILLVPFTVWGLLQEFFGLAFSAFMLAGLTDAIDGYLARRFRWQSELGTYLDPLADKLLLVAVFTTLALQVHVPMWLAILVVSRDLLIVGGIVLSRYLGKPMVMQPLLISKLNTAGQIVFVALVMAALAFGFHNTASTAVAGALVSVLTVWSFAVYMRRWLAHMAGPMAGPRQ